jgi:hypothetical protein
MVKLSPALCAINFTSFSRGSPGKRFSGEHIARLARGAILGGRIFGNLRQLPLNFGGAFWARADQSSFTLLQGYLVRLEQIHVHV